MTDYGITGAKMIISTLNTASLPTGDRFYFWSPTIKGNYTNGSTIKQLTGGSSYSNRGGKRNWSVMLTDCYVVADAGHTATAEFGLVLKFFQTACKTGAAPCYLWIQNEADSVYMLLGNNTAITAQTAELKGYVVDYSWEMMPGALYKFNIKFQECLS